MGVYSFGFRPPREGVLAPAAPFPALGCEPAVPPARRFRGPVALPAAVAGLRWTGAFFRAPEAEAPVPCSAFGFAAGRFFLGETAVGGVASFVDPLEVVFVARAFGFPPAAGFCVPLAPEPDAGLDLEAAFLRASIFSSEAINRDTSARQVGWCRVTAFFPASAASDGGNFSRLGTFAPPTRTGIIRFLPFSAAWISLLTKSVSFFRPGIHPSRTDDDEHNR